MTSAVAHLHALAATGRPAGSASEAHARRYAEAQLTALGFAVHEEPFEYSAFPGEFATPVVGAALALTLVASATGTLMGEERLGVVVFIAGVVTVGLFARRMLDSAVLDLPWMRRQGVNVVATRGSSTPTVWLVAHLDSKSQPIPSGVRVAGVAVLAAAVVLASVGAVLTLAGGAPRVMSWIIIASSAAGAIPVMMSTVGNRSHGAVDNASGVAAVLGAAALTRPGVNVGVLLPSAEELGLAGARAFVRVRAKGVTLNCDGVDDEGDLVIMYNNRAPSRVLAAVKRAADATQATPVRARRMPLGLLTDSTAFARAGWEAVTVSHGSMATLGRVHTSRDSLACLRGSSVDSTARILAGAVETLAS